MHLTFNVAKNKSGITLVETLIALLLMTIVLTALMHEARVFLKLNFHTKELTSKINLFKEAHALSRAKIRGISPLKSKKTIKFTVQDKSTNLSAECFLDRRIYECSFVDKNQGTKKDNLGKYLSKLKLWNTSL